MNKYIRTKDGVFLADIEWTSNPPKNIAIKRANTIEELCDLFVIWNKKNMFVFWNTSDAPIKDVKKLYGAIWTDKGLIYVAKMNKRGELELL